MARRGLAGGGNGCLNCSRAAEAESGSKRGGREYDLTTGVIGTAPRGRVDTSGRGRTGGTSVARGRLSMARTVTSVM